MKHSYLLGIDAGTSKIKAVLFDLAGHELYTSSCKTHLIKNKLNHVELDMNELWSGLVGVIKNLITTNQIDPKSIKALGITGQGEGCWLMDKKGLPLSPAILWCDGRSANIVNKLKLNKVLCKSIKDITGSHIFPGATSLILKWINEHDPGRLKKAQYCVTCTDWLRFKLTGQVYSEITNASTSLLNLLQYHYSDEVLDLLQIKDIKRLLPPLLASSQIAGYITPEASWATGLIQGTPVSGGMLDIVATAVGTGTINPHHCCTILGTTCCNEIVRENLTSSPHDTSGFECHAVKNLYLNVMASMAGTTNLDWIINILFPAEKKKAQEQGKNIFTFLENKIKDIPSGSQGLIYHPYLNTAGERAPFYDPYAKAQFFGISENAGKYHLLKSVYEGVAFSIKDCLSQTQNIHNIHLGGGGANSNIWGQIIADCLGKEIIVPEGQEFAAKGAALSAGVAIQVFANITSAAQKTLKIRKSFTPNLSNTSIYEDFFKLYKALRQKNSQLWNLRNEILLNPRE